MPERMKQASLRGMTRFYAVQIVYCAEITKKTIGEVIIDFQKNNMEIYLTENDFFAAIDEEFFSELLKALEANLENVDELIHTHLNKNWKLERLDLVEKSILRLGVTELLYLKNVPANVIFNEYIEISKAFFEKPEVSFVNGILNKISNQIKALS